MAKVKRFPPVVYMTIDDSGGEEVLLAWNSIDSAETGKVAVYRLESELEKREVCEVRRSGTKQWFKP